MSSHWRSEWALFHGDAFNPSQSTTFAAYISAKDKKNGFKDDEYPQPLPSPPSTRPTMQHKIQARAHSLRNELLATKQTVKTEANCGAEVIKYSEVSQPSFVVQSKHRYMTNKEVQHHLQQNQRSKIPPHQRPEAIENYNIQLKERIIKNRRPPPIHNSQEGQTAGVLSKHESEDVNLFRRVENLEYQLRRKTHELEVLRDTMCEHSIDRYRWIHRVQDMEQQLHLETSRRQIAEKHIAVLQECLDFNEDMLEPQRRSTGCEARQVVRANEQTGKRQREADVEAEQQGPGKRKRMVG